MKVFLRDVAIVWGLTFLFGLVVGIGAGVAKIELAQAQLSMAAGNFIFGIVGFTIVGALTKTDRFQIHDQGRLCPMVCGPLQSARGLHDG